jgi:threonine aldolase
MSMSAAESQPLDESAEMIRQRCTRAIAHHYRRSPHEVLTALAAEAAPELEADRYGQGGPLTAFEEEVAALLGKEAAVFMPSGTMCQQIALRLWSERRGGRNIGMHPLNHLDLFEHAAYERLHGLRGVPIGDPARLLTLDDLRATAEPLAALLYELPQREIGGQLPSWDELAAISAWCADRGIARHLDGARLWECGPFYGRPYAEIAALFDTVYVSFYKGLGGIAGAILAGPADLIAEARVWRRRHGGTLIALYPYILSARQGLRERLDRMGAYHEKAIAIAAGLAQLPGIDVVPDPPQTNMMHLYLRGDAERLLASARVASAATGIWTFDHLGSTPVPGVQKWEWTVGDATLDVPTEELVALFATIVRRANS